MGTWRFAHQGSNTDPAQSLLQAIWAVSATEVWFGGPNVLIQYRNGAYVDAFLSTIQISSITADDAGVMLGGSPIGLSGNGVVVTFDAGLTWDGGDVLGQSNATAGDVYTVWSAATQRYAAGAGSAVYRAPSWNNLAQVSIGEGVLSSWGHATDDFWVTTYTTGAHQLQHHTNAGWSSTLVALPSTMAVSGTPSNQVWVAGLGSIGRVESDGGLTLLDAGVEYSWNALYAASETAVFFAGYDTISSMGVLARWDGHSFSVSSKGPSAFWASHGTGPGDVWASSAAGTIYHYTVP
jgi:hypothetical protein